jgi:hypothetical protein
MYVCGGAAIVALLAVAVTELRYGFLRSGPRVSRGPVTSGAGLIAIVDSAKLTELAGDEIRDASGWPVPDWAVRRMLPHEGGVAALLNFDLQRVDLRVYVNPKTLAPVGRRLGETLRFSDAFPRIRWKKGSEEPARGLLMKEGVVAFAPEAEEAFWYTWSQSIKQSPPEFEGGHLLEAVFDNRQGHAFLIVASLLDAYEIELGAEETDISLSSLQFVREARLTADLAPPDSIRFRFVLDILPEHIEKLGVVNLKVGLDDVIKEHSDRWQREHGLKLEGQSAWDGTTIVYDYRLSSARQAFHLLVRGELK